MVADGVRGAALGAIGGAIAGDAGEGAAIGAAASTVFGAGPLEPFFNKTWRPGEIELVK